MDESSQGLDDIDPDLVSPGQISQQEDSMPLTQKSGNRDQKWGGRGKRPRFSPDASADNRGGSHERNVELDTEYDEEIVAGIMFEQPVSQALGRVSQRRSHGPFVDTDSVPLGSQGLDYADSEFQAHEPQAHEPQAPDAEAPDATELGQDPGASQSQRDQRQENRAHKEENFHYDFVGHKGQTSRLNKIKLRARPQVLPRQINPRPSCPGYGSLPRNSRQVKK